jgi:hypothetical protein
MNSTVRKKSPRAPSISLSEALDRALKVYDRDRLHPAPSEVFAQNLGYKSANSGSALTMIASLRYFGLVSREGEGVLAITKDVEAYKFAPEDHQRRALLRQFLRSPALYSELLDKYASGLPSDANLRYELIQRGFSPAAAESVLSAFRESVNFVGYFDSDEALAEASAESALPSPSESVAGPAPASALAAAPKEPVSQDEDRIPVRLPGGRRAWLVIPTPFFESDKARLRAQIDLLLTQDEEDDLVG